MTIITETGETRDGMRYVALVDEATKKVLLKAYLSPDETKVRIVMPELVNWCQTEIRPNQHLIELTRDAEAAQREVRSRNRSTR